MSYPLQVVVPTYEVQVSLRRFRLGEDYDSATVVIGQVTMDMSWHAEMVLPDMVDFSLNDPRWPTRGEAGLLLAPQHESHVCHRRLFRRPDGVLQTADELPFGAAYEVADDGSPSSKYYWERISREYVAQHAGRRGLYLIKLPAASAKGEWFSPDWMWGRPSENPKREGWTVTGTLSDLSVSPSIDSQGSYHGFLGWQGTPPGHLSHDINNRGY